MEKNYFIMLHTMDGGLIAMTQSDGETVALYATKEEAETAVDENVLAQFYGYEIFQRGYGE
jgi:hypothetical protein